MFFINFGILLCGQFCRAAMGYLEVNKSQLTTRPMGHLAKWDWFITFTLSVPNIHTIAILMVLEYNIHK